jgi:hypothetical protein
LIVGIWTKVFGPFTYGRSRFRAPVDQSLEIQIHEAIHVAACPHGRHAASEIQSRETLAELPVYAWSGRVVEVLVHHDEARDHALAGEIDRGCASGNVHARVVADVHYRAVLDDDRLTRARGCTGAVDDPHIRQRDEWRIR